VAVAATAPIMPDGGEPPADAYGQAKRCLEIVAAALEQVGSSILDVVRTRCYLVAAEDWKEVGRAHGDVFGDVSVDVRPASSMIVVTGFIDPRWRVEIEADAILDES
jgi:enamine deaminase RidA (YjgF/YER057c/UK114 family)